jgi:hypothetical protein
VHNERDLATSERWLQSRRRARSRRFAEARAATRRRLGQRGTIALMACMSLAVGGAAAHQTKPTAKTAVVKSAGVEIADLQRALGVTADGVIGPQTRRAIRAFQRSKGLEVDGVAGPATLAALGLTAAKAAPTDLLAKIAQCESGGDPTAVSADGRYRGKYQFSRPTWRALGGTGDPAAAPEAEQDRLAAELLQREGTSPWPVCGR